jgi:alanine racemase
MKLLTYFRQFKKSFSGYRPLIEVLVYKDRLLHNLEVFRRKYPRQQIAPVLKSNGYGHGLVPVAKILDQEKIAFLIVDSHFEAVTLVKEGIKSKILVIGYTRPGEIKRNRYRNVSFNITSLDQLKKISQILNRPQHFHLKIDTCMHRQGILISEIESAVAIIKSNPKIILEGICSHFCSADSADKKYSRFQMKNWSQAVKEFKKSFAQLKYFHLAATGGSYYEPKNTNVIRLGMGLYGIDPSPNRRLELQPALELRTIITGIKEIKKDGYIGYGLTFRAKKNMRIATVPAGYFEGVDRRLSNCGCFKVGYSFCPILGRVSMNISVIDVSRLAKIKVGDPVILISKEKTDANSALEIAKLCETIPYEILVHIPQHLRRTVVF